MTLPLGVVARIVHRNADGTRCKTISPQGLPSYKALLDTYPSHFDDFMATFGNIKVCWMVKNYLWLSSEKDNKKVYLKLLDGTELTLQG